MEQERKISLGVHVLVLASIFAASVWAFTLFSGQELTQFYVVIAAAVAHVSWGVIYHYLNKRLTGKLVAEYMFIAAIVLLLFTWAFLFS
jgi:hypothetical protein